MDWGSGLKVIDCFDANSTVDIGRLTVILFLLGLLFVNEKKTLLLQRHCIF